MNEEIAEGIKFAMSKGESLQQAMQSFYNAGYKKEEVEEAAKNLQGQLHVESEKGIHAVLPEIKAPVQRDIREKNIGSGFEGKSMQKVSSYGAQAQAENPRRKMIILVSALLGVLIIIFAGIFFFRNYLIGLFGRIFG